MISVDKLINDWKDSNSIQDAYGTPYKYALYVCGGDFKQFDNIDKLLSFFESVKVQPVKLNGDMANQFNESFYDDEYGDDLPY